MLPLLITPFLFFLFYALGGGGGTIPSIATNGLLGFNPELPPAKFDKEKKIPTKLDLYEKADKDSIKRKEYLRQDPYHAKITDPNPSSPEPNQSSPNANQSSPNTNQSSPNANQSPYHINQLSPYQPPASPAGNPATPGVLPPEDPKADELLKRLDQLRKSIGSGGPAGVKPLARTPIDPPLMGPSPARPTQHLIRSAPPDPADEDPQLQKLNTMLDKIIRIQHSAEDPSTGELPGEATITTAREYPGSELISADTNASNTSNASNAIPAAIPEDQTLVAGATIALRLTEATQLGRIRLPKDQWVYGVVSIDNDRMLITIHSIRQEHSIYSTDLQVYDMDGLPGIHIPGTLNREVAKQSADQGIGGINLSAIDPSIGAQAANAGIQATKSLLSRKVKLIRISVRAGYQVLLRNTKSSTATIAAPVKSAEPSIHPPQEITLRPFLHHTAIAEKLTLTLRSIYLQQNILWLSLLICNDAPIDYIPAYTRWTIRDRHQWKRTAIQDLPLTPVWSPPVPPIPGYSNRALLIGLRPFALPKDKKLVLQIGEANGARVLTLIIDHKDLLKTKTR